VLRLGTDVSFGKRLMRGVRGVKEAAT
jgi:hypothetical protein